MVIIEGKTLINTLNFAYFKDCFSGMDSQLP